MQSHSPFDFLRSSMTFKEHIHAINVFLMENKNELNIPSHLEPFVNEFARIEMLISSYPEVIVRYHVTLAHLITSFMQQFDLASISQKEIAFEKIAKNEKEQIIARFSLYCLLKNYLQQFNSAKNAEIDKIKNGTRKLKMEKEYGALTPEEKFTMTYPKFSLPPIFSDVKLKESNEKTFLAQENKDAIFILQLNGITIRLDDSGQFATVFFNNPKNAKCFQAILLSQDREAKLKIEFDQHNNFVSAAINISMTDYDDIMQNPLVYFDNYPELKATMSCGSNLSESDSDSEEEHDENNISSLKTSVEYKNKDSLDYQKCYSSFFESPAIHNSDSDSEEESYDSRYICDAS
jgi:hypothetical protein